MKFKNKKEFAEAIMKHGQLYDDEGYKVCFDESHQNPFRFINAEDDSNQEINVVWDEYNKEWHLNKMYFSSEPLSRKELKKKVRKILNIYHIDDIKIEFIHSCSDYIHGIHHVGFVGRNNLFSRHLDEKDFKTIKQYYD